MVTLFKEMFTVPTNRKRASQHLPDGLATNDRHQRHQHLRSSDIQQSRYYGYKQRPLFHGHIRNRQSRGMHHVPPVHGGFARPYRRSLLVSSVGQTICMFYIGLYMRISPPSGSGGALTPQGLRCRCRHIYLRCFSSSLVGVLPAGSTCLKSLLPDCGR